MNGLRLFPRLFSKGVSRRFCESKFADDSRLVKIYKRGIIPTFAAGACITIKWMRNEYHKNSGDPGLAYLYGSIFSMSSALAWPIAIPVCGCIYYKYTYGDGVWESMRKG